MGVNKSNVEEEWSPKIACFLIRASHAKIPTKIIGVMLNK